MKWPLELIYPWMLLGSGGLFFFFHWHRRSVALMTPRRRAISLGLRCAIFLVVVFALTDPRWLTSRRQTHVLWLVDVSRSVQEEAVKTARTFIQEAVKDGTIPSQSWGAFAGSVTALPDAAALDSVSPQALANDSTNLAQAFSFADATFPAGYARTIVLFSDGVETSGDAAAQAARLQERGIRVHVVPVRPPEQPEVLVRSVTAPRSVSENEPFRVSAEIISNRAQSAAIDLFRNGVRVGIKDMELKAGLNTFETTQSTEGVNIIDFSVAVRAPQDTVVDNNQSSAVIQAKGKSKALLLTDKPDLSRNLSLALRQEGVLLDVRPPAGAPSDLADLQNYDLLMIDNVSATDLSPAQMNLMASYVRDFGGGFLMLGGDNSFGLGGYYQTAVEEILPVRCDFEKEKETPSLGLVLVVDRSGSMSGEKIEMAKDASKAAVELMGQRDYIGVNAFDNEAFWVAELQAATDKTGVQQKIASIEPGGGTNIAPGLEQAYAALSASPAKIKHVILLTDGVSSPGPFYELTTRMSQDHITVSTVAVGADADQKLLEQIAQWGGGRFYFTDNPQNVPQIFARETMTASKSALQENPFSAKVAKPGEFLAGLDFETAPFLLGYVMTKIKPTAELWLMTERGDPLLATWRYGLGQSGAFSSDARNRWAVEWLKWEGYGKFWVQTVRKLKRIASLKNSPATVTREKNGYHLRIDTVDEKGGFISDYEGDALVVGPDGQQHTYPLNLTAPGKMETWWPAAKRGTYHTRLVLRRGGQTVESQYISATLGYPDEFLLRPPDETLLRKIADGTGGTYAVTPPGVLAGDDRRADLERELWPWLVSLGLLLFVADVAARRLPEDPSQIKPAARKTKNPRTIHQMAGARP